jgi:broad specificity phosphatase PhoE
VRKAQFARDLEYSNVIDALVIAFKSIKYIKEIKLKIKSLLIIRQGETEQSIAGGWFDSRLTQSGVTQITRLKDEISEKIKDLEEVYILSSDLNRARETVKILFNDKYPIKYDQRLRESNDAHLTSLDVDATKTKHHNEQLDKIEFGENYPNEESAEGYYNRVYDCFLGINEQYQNKNVVIVTHEGAYGIIKSIINGTVWSSKQRYVLGCSEVFAYQVQP